MKALLLILLIFGTAALFAPRPTQYRIKGQPDYPIDDVTLAELALLNSRYNIHEHQQAATGAGGTRLRMPIPPWPTPTPRK